MLPMPYAGMALAELLQAVMWEAFSVLVEDALALAAIGINENSEFETSVSEVKKKGH